MPSWSPCSICCNSRPAVSNAWPQQETSLLRLRGHLWVLCHDMWLKYKIIWTKVLHAHRRKKYYKDATDWYYYFCVVLSRVQLFVTPQTAAHQAPLSTEFSRQEYWRGLPLPTPGIFLTQGPNTFLASAALALHYLGSPILISTEPFLKHRHGYLPGY